MKIGGAILEVQEQGELRGQGVCGHSSGTHCSCGSFVFAASMPGTSRTPRPADAATLPAAQAQSDDTCMP
jgi:hypothetical protein